MQDNAGTVYHMKACSSAQCKSNFYLLELSNSRFSAHEHKMWPRGRVLKTIPALVWVPGIIYHPNRSQGA